MLHITNLFKHYGDCVIFENASVTIAEDQKIGVIGRNGSGKTTLCKIILGQEEPDAGEIAGARAMEMGYLQQQDPFRPGETVLEFLSRHTGKEEWLCGKVAGQFQLKGPLLPTSISALSGGYQTRVKLAAMLLHEPDFLILDEPSNYLDLKTLLLLENFLSEFRGGFLIVSHDREFLKRTCAHTLEVDGGKIHLFPGNIEAYLERKEELREMARKQNEKVEGEQRRLQRFIEANRAKAATASQVQSKLKYLARLEKIEIEKPYQAARVPLKMTETKNGVALRCRGLKIGYSQKTVADEIFVEVGRGRHVAVLGDNGEGKTTFLRTIGGNLPPLDGSFQWGHGLRPAVYAQHVYTALDPGDTVGSCLRKAAVPGTTSQEVLDMAGAFLFRGDEVEKRVPVLSGGERARVCLASILLSGSPVLLLDEPTSHLDFETVEALGHALRQYAGTIFFTSHDRTFVNLVANNILEIRDGRIRNVPDSYESYVYQLAKECAEEPEVSQQPESVAPATPPKAAGQSPRRVTPRVRKLQEAIRLSEEKIAAYERQREGVHEFFLQNPTVYAPDQQARLEDLNAELLAEETLWIEMQEELESLGRET